MKIPKVCKVVLVLMLVSVVVLGNTGSIKALSVYGGHKEPLYYYDKYSIDEKYVEGTWKLVSSDIELAFKGKSEHFNGRKDEWVTDKDNGYRRWGYSYRYDSQENEFKILGKDTEREVKVGHNYYCGGGSYVEKKVVKRSKWKTKSYPSKWGESYPSSESGTFFYGDKYKKSTYDSQSKKIKGSLIVGNIKLPSSYPVDGIHTDGYWYVRKGIVNSNPTLSLSTPNQNNYFGKNKPINVSGSVKDSDTGDKLTIKYTINGRTNNLKTITANGRNQSFSKNIPIDSSIPQGTRTLKIWVEDNKGGKSSEVSRIIKIDKTAPSSPTITLSNNNWTNQNVTVTIVHGSKSSGAYQSGVQKSQYKIGNGSWTNYNSSFTVKNEGVTKIYARTIDKVGNISREASKEIKIDKRKPKLKIIVGN